MSAPTREQEKEYLAKGGVICPFCKDQDIRIREGGNNLSHTVLTQIVDCRACGASWVDVYELAGIAAQ